MIFAPLISTVGRPAATIRNIVSFEVVDDLIVSHLTVFADLDLPESVLANFDNFSQDLVNITWAQGSYDEEVQGTYTLTGTPIESEGIKNPLNVTASIDVIVSAPATIVAQQISLSNKYVDLFFDHPIYGDNAASTPITTADIEIFDTVSGGVTVFVIASIKKANHYLSASATNLAGGESVIRVFITLTGTPDGSESFKIRPIINSIYTVDGFPIPVTETTGLINLHINPYTLWDVEDPSTVTVTSLGASTVVDLMGVENLTQTTDADRPAYLRNASLSFDRANTEFLNGAAQATFEKQQANNFSIVIKGLKPDLGTNSGWVIAYFSGTLNHGWTVRAGSAGGGGVQFFMMDNVTAQQAALPNFEDQKASFIFVNEGGVLSIYDENNNRVGSQGTATIGTITYSSFTLFVGRRAVSATNYFNGEWNKMAFYNSALTSGQRIKIFSALERAKSNLKGTLTKYLYPVLNGSIDPTFKDTMQCFLGDVDLKDGIYYMWYSANAADGDIDRAFLATKSSSTPFAPFTKVLDAGAPKVILAPSGVNGTYDEDEVLIRSCFWDEDQSHFKHYFTANQIGASPAYTVGLATSFDGENLTKYGQIYTDGTTNIIFIAVHKVSTNDYRAVVTTSATGGDTNNFSYDYLTSLDGISWIKVGSINSLLSKVIIVLKLIKIGDSFYMVCTSDGRDSDASLGSRYIIYKTLDFTASEYVGELFSKFEPSERGIGGISIIENNNQLEIFYSYFKNQNKTAANGGEAYTAIRQATLDGPTLQQPTVVNSYPAWIKKYWPLNPESATGSAFMEMIDGDTASFPGAQWSLDGLNFFDFLGTGFTFPNNGLIFSATDFALKMRVEIVLTGTINLFSSGTDIVVQLVSGNLRVALNNATKDYITTADIAKPSGITDPGNHVYVGFIWQGGALRLCVGNNTNVSVTQTVNNAMTNIANAGSDVLICSGATIEARSVVTMSGQTDDQWINTDL